MSLLEQEFHSVVPTLQNSCAGKELKKNIHRKSRMMNRRVSVAKATISRRFGVVKKPQPVEGAVL